MPQNAKEILNSPAFTALLKNREVGLITDNVAEVTKMATTIDADFAKGVPF